MKVKGKHVGYTLRATSIGGFPWFAWSTSDVVHQAKVKDDCYIITARRHGFTLRCRALRLACGFYIERRERPPVKATSTMEFFLAE